MTITLPEATLLEQLLKLPRLPVVAQRLDALVADEAGRRAHFIETVLECEKAEFINGEKIVQSPAKFKHTAIVGNLLRLIRDDFQCLWRQQAPKRLQLTHHILSVRAESPERDDRGKTRKN